MKINELSTNYVSKESISFEYDDDNKNITLSAGGRTFNVNARPFLKDGHVISAYFDDSNRVTLEFNQDAGLQPIRFYITDVLNDLKAGSGITLSGKGVGRTVSLDYSAVVKPTDLTSYAQKSELPTRVSELLNDAGYLTEHQSLAAYAKKTELPTKVSELVNDSNFLTAHQSLDGYATQYWVNNQGFLTEHQSLTAYAKKAEIPTKVSELVNDAGYLSAH